MLRLSKIIVLIVIWGLFLGAGDAEQTVKASVDKTKISTGELFTYSLLVEGVFSSLQVVPPEFKDFKIASQSQSQSYSLSGKATQITVKLSYSLYAATAGEFTIEAASVLDKGKEYKSNSIIVSVEGKPLSEKKKILPLLKKGLQI